MAAPRVEPERIAVLIPCLNEERTIAKVVADFRSQLPAAEIYVFDNGSDDRTVANARNAGAQVVPEARRGKGYVVQSMLRTIDADVYVLVDGDGTYPSDVVGHLIAPIQRGDADMVIGSRLHRGAASQFSLLNRWGNQAFAFLLRRLFGMPLTDLLSGYRAFNRRAARAVSLAGGGFETETELTINLLCTGFRIIEVPASLRPRAAGSHSKIRIVRDGLAILTTMLTLLRRYKPRAFRLAMGLAILVVAAALGLALTLSVS